MTGEESDLALVVSTLILATTFTPIRERLQSIAERRFRPETDGDSVAESLVDLRVELRQVSEKLAQLEQATATSAADDTHDHTRRRPHARSASPGR